MSDEISLEDLPKLIDEKDSRIAELEAENTKLQERAREAERERDELIAWQFSSESHSAIAQAGLVREPGEGGISAIRRVVQQLTAAEAKLARIKAAADDDEIDLNTMRDGSKLTRHGVVQSLMYWREEAEEAKAKLAKVREIVNQANIELSKEDALLAIYVVLTGEAERE